MRAFNDAARPPGPRAPLSLADARARAADARAAVLVEGWSDEAALEALARRRGRDLHAEGLCIVPMGGATNLRAFAGALGAGGLGLRLAGLCDAAESALFERGLAHGAVFVCDADLEDELIRALGAAAVEHVLEMEGELSSFRSFQAQPAQRGRSLPAQLRRFMGTRAGRKIRYGALLVDALAPDRVPPVLDRLLDSLIDDAGD